MPSKRLVGTGTYGVSQSPLHFIVSLLLLCVASLLEKSTCLLVDDFAELAYATAAGASHKAVRLQYCHPIVHLPHDNQLALSISDVGTWTTPVYVEQCHFQGLLSKELQPHLFIL